MEPSLRTCKYNSILIDKVAQLEGHSLDSKAKNASDKAFSTKHRFLNRSLTNQ